MDRRYSCVNDGRESCCRVQVCGLWQDSPMDYASKHDPTISQSATLGNGATEMKLFRRSRKSLEVFKRRHDYVNISDHEEAMTRMMMLTPQEYKCSACGKEARSNSGTGQHPPTDDTRCPG